MIEALVIVMVVGFAVAGIVGFVDDYRIHQDYSDWK
jgi:hypothetical protein